MKIRVAPIYDPLKNLIVEEANQFLSEIDADIAHDKFYKKINKNVYDKLVALDPTFNKERNNLGNYIRWIVSQFEKKAITAQNLEDVKTALQSFHQHKNQLEKKDINQYTVDELIAVTADAETLQLRSELKKIINKNIYNKELRKNFLEFIGTAIAHDLGVIENAFKGIFELDKETQVEFGKKSSRFTDPKEYIQYANAFVEDISEGFTYNIVNQKIESLSNGIAIKFRDEEKQMIIVQVYNYEASKAIGSVNWCISYDEGHWDQYVTEPDNNMFFIFNFNLNGSDGDSAIGIAMTKENEPYGAGGNAAIHDKFDNYVPEDRFWSIIDQMGIKANLFLVNERAHLEKKYSNYTKKVRLPKSYFDYDKDTDRLTINKNYQQQYKTSDDQISNLKRMVKDGKHLDLILKYLQNYSIEYIPTSYDHEMEQEVELEPDVHRENLLVSGLDSIDDVDFLTKLYSKYYNLLNPDSRRAIAYKLKDAGVDLLKLVKQTKERVGKPLAGDEFSLAAARGEDMRAANANKMRKIIKGEPVDITEKEIEYAIDNGYEKLWNKVYVHRLDNVLDYPISYEDVQIIKKLGLVDKMAQAILQKSQYGIESLNSIEKSIYDHAKVANENFSSSKYKVIKSYNPVEYLIKESIDEVSYGYRAGNLEDVPEKLNKFASGRGTGHFGTGFYFFGDENDAINYDDREVNKVDFDKYNLLKVTNDGDGLNLHNALKNFEGINIKGFLNTKDKLYLEQLFTSERNGNPDYRDMDMNKTNVFAENITYPLKKFINNNKEIIINEIKNSEYGNKDFDDVDLEIEEEYTIDENKGHYNHVYNYIADKLDKNRIKNVGFHSELYNSSTFMEYFNSLIDSEINNYVNNMDKTKVFYDYVNPYINILAKMVSKIDPQNHNEESAKEILQKSIIPLLRRDTYTKQHHNKTTLGTELIKSLGYNGIDVRNTNVDNSGYGSVIYDLNKTK